MNFSLTSVTSIELCNKDTFIDDISKCLSTFFKSKNYGKTVQNILIGVICVSDKFEQFTKEHEFSYEKSKVVNVHGEKIKLICTVSFDLKIDFNVVFNSSSDKSLKKYLLTTLVSRVIEEQINFRKLTDFDYDLFLDDLKKCNESYSN